ncbi:MAG: hypothetical protein ACFB10_10380 [Salibacteraceae bacterium]
MGVNRSYILSFRAVCLSLLLFFGIAAKAQNRFAERPISLQLKQVTLEEALFEVGQAGGFELAYNPSRFPVDSLLNLTVERIAAGKVVRQLLGNNISMVQSGQHLVIRLKKPSGSGRLPKNRYVIKGVIVNQQTGKVVSNATVYDVDRLYSALTDAQGYYELEVNSRAPVLGLTVTKNAFLDTLILIEPQPNLKLDVQLRPKEPLPDKMPMKAVAPDAFPATRVDELALVRLWTTDEVRLQAQNRSYLEPRLGQISVLPGVGSNRLMSGAVENTVSFNLLSGYSGGLNGIEVGGLVNILREDMIGVQVGGWANVVGGKISGLQVGGLYNRGRKDVHGIQVGGLFNTTGGSVKGMQIGGLFNLTEGAVRGFQVGGLFNQTQGAVQGFQIGGLFNYSGSNVKVMQIGGLFNMGENVGGIQLAGLFNQVEGAVGGLQVAGLYNEADSVGMLQLSGLVNQARTIRGLQLAGLVNVAKKVEGSQLSIINISDTVTGVAFGFLSIARHGYHALEFSTDDILFANLHLKLGGNHRIYIQFSVCIRTFESNKPITGIGYGLGTLFPLKDAEWWGRVELSTHHLSRNSLFDTDFQLLNRIRPALVWRPRPHWDVSLGPAINVIVYDPVESQDREWLNDLGARWMGRDSQFNVIRLWGSAQAGIAWNF